MTGRSPYSPLPVLSPTDSLCDHLFRCTAEYGHAVAMLDPETGESLLYSDLPSRVRTIAASLHSLGVKPRDVIGIVAGNSLSYPLVCLAVTQIGAIACPANPAYKKYEILKSFSLARVSWIITEPEYLEKVEECSAELRLTGILLLSELGTATNTTVTNYHIENAEQTAFIFFSSGTTGPPKGILLSHRSVAGHIQQAIHARSHPSPLHPLLSPADTIFGVLPFFHAGGLITHISMLSQGVRILINRRWDEHQFLHTIQEHKVTAINIVPPILAFLSAHPIILNYNLSTLRYLFVGASRVDSSHISTVSQRIPNCQVVQLFGMTEAGVTIFMTPQNNQKVDSVGIPLPGIEFKILSETATVCEDHRQIGELWLKAPTMMSGYLDGEIISSWFNTGDLASVDAEGFIYIEGRTKDMIKVRGWQVSPYELEDAISKLEGIDEVAVIGVPHPTDGHRPHAVIVGNRENNVFQFVKENFVSYKHLAGITYTNVLPKTPSGKISRIQLVERLQLPNSSL